MDCRRDMSHEVQQSFTGGLARRLTATWIPWQHRTGSSPCIYVYVINLDICTLNAAKRQSGKRREIIRWRRTALHLARFPFARRQGLVLSTLSVETIIRLCRTPDRAGGRRTMRLAFRNFLPRESRREVHWAESSKGRDARRFGGGETKFRNGFLGN